MQERETKRETKIFRDNIHGYIDVPIDYVSKFIDTEVFQRLRGIEQTGMRILYPSARHDRFIHSLGVFYLGRKAFSCFRKNVSFNSIKFKNRNGKNYYDIFDDIERSNKFWDTYGILFEIACLLHDCGHAPFSHALEELYEMDRVTNGSSLDNQLLIKNGSIDFENDYKNQGAPHEKMSALLVCTEFKENICELMKKYELIDDAGYTDIEFIVRCIIGCHYSAVNNTESQIKNCLIELLHSNSIDVDSLDYIVRDSKLSGVDNMSVDIERLLSSLTLVEISSCNNIELNNKSISANIVKGEFKSAKISHYNGTIKGPIYIEGDVEGSFEGDIIASGNFIIEENYENEQGLNCVFFINGARYENEVHKTQNINSIEIKGTLGKPIKIKGNDIKFDLGTSSKINISFKRATSDCCFINGKINSCFDGKMLFRSDSSDRLDSEYRLGYHKSSLSIIQNVITARNYEYQWIYSHHKVVYYANYLIVELLRQCVKLLLGCSDEETKKEISNLFSWKHMVGKDEVEYEIYQTTYGLIYRLTDADVMYLFKYCLLKCRKDGNTDSDIYKLLNEYYSRRYRKSLWKSYAEYNTFLCDFTENEKITIFERIKNNSSFNHNGHYGYLNEIWSRKFESFGYRNVVWVNGDSKLKNLDPDKTYIVFKDGSMTYRAVSSQNEINPVTKLGLFYIYSDFENEKTNKKQLVDFLKDEIKKINKT